MTPDPTLAALALIWKDPEVVSLARVTPARLSHTARWEDRIGRAAIVFFVGFALAVGVSGWLGGEPARVVLGVFVAALAVVLGRGLRGLRARTKAADALLLGPPVEVARGHRQHIHARLCSIRSPTAIGVSLAPILLSVGLAAYGALPMLVALAAVVGYAGWLGWVHVRTVPALRAEVARLDQLIGELEEP